MKRNGESFLEREGRMVKCEEEKNEENGERGGRPSVLFKRRRRACLVGCNKDGLC